MNRLDYFLCAMLFLAALLTLIVYFLLQEKLLAQIPLVVTAVLWLMIWKRAKK